MDKFLSDQRLLVFIGGLCLAVCSWGAGFKTWPELLTTQAIFGLFGIIGGVLIANVGHNVFTTPPTITTTTTPKSTVETITTTPPVGDK